MFIPTNLELQNKGLWYAFSNNIFFNFPANLATQPQLREHYKQARKNGKALTTELVLWKRHKQGATLRERCYRTSSFVDRTGNNFKLQISNFLCFYFIILLEYYHASTNCRLTIKVHYGGSNGNIFQWGTLKRTSK